MRGPAPGACDPEPQREVAADRVTETLPAVADVVDVKVPGMAGHSRAVAGLAEGAAARLGRPAAVQSHLRYAGLVHDLGRVTVSNDAWNRPGALRRSRARPALPLPAGTVLRSLVLAGAGRCARVAATGAPRRFRESPRPHWPVLDERARILQAADCYRAMVEHRAHRPAMEPARAAAALRSEAAGGWTPRSSRRCSRRRGSGRRSGRPTRPG